MPNQHARPLTRNLPDADLPFSLDSLWFSADPARLAAQVVEAWQFRGMAQEVGMTIAKSGSRQGERAPLSSASKTRGRLQDAGPQDGAVARRNGKNAREKHDVER